MVARCFDTYCLSHLLESRDSACLLLELATGQKAAPGVHSALSRLNLFKKNLCVRADGTDSSKYLGWTAELASLPTKQTSASRSQPMSARLGQPYCISQVGLSHKLECGGSEGILTERRGSRARRKKDEFHVSYPIQFRLQMRCRMERPQYDAKQRATISALRGWTGSCFCCGLTPRACSTRRILGPK